MKRGLRFLVPLVLCGLTAGLCSARADAQVPADDLEVILAIDTSGSMRPAIESAKAAANEFVAAMPAGVRIGVETFADDVTLLTSPTTDRAVLSDLINSIETGGDTALYDVVVAASQHFTPTAKTKVLVLLSDGKDDGSTATLDEAVAAVEGEHVEAISLTTATTDISSLEALGTVTSADDAAGVSAAFARVASLLAAVVVPIEVPSTSAPTTTVAPSTTPAPTTPASTTAEAAATTVDTHPAVPAATGPSSEGSASSPRLWVGAVGIFAGLFLIGLLLFPRKRVSKARLGIQKPRSVSDMGMRTMSAVEGARAARKGRAGDDLSVAGISMQPASSWHRRRGRLRSSAASVSWSEDPCSPWRQRRSSASAPGST